MEHNPRDMPVRVDPEAMQREGYMDMLHTGMAKGTWFWVLDYVYELLVWRRPPYFCGGAGDGRGNDDGDGDAGGVRVCHDYDDVAGVVDGSEISALYASPIWANRWAS